MMYDVVKKVYDIIKEKREQEKHVSELGNHVALQSGGSNLVFEYFWYCFCCTGYLLVAVVMQSSQ